VAYALAIGQSWAGVNDFEEAVFARHPEIGAAKRKLKRLGAKQAMMTGSGAAVFGLFDSAAERDAAAARFGQQRTFPFLLLSRPSYRATWARSLKPLVE
jgi:4-diphosphocytidyl-2-C-methyl-D-erythritol kinase